MCHEKNEECVNVYSYNANKSYLQVVLHKPTLCACNCTLESRRMSDFPAKEVTCCYTVPLHHVARPRYPGSPLSGGVL